jgi:hypothetical protein
VNKVHIKLKNKVIKMLNANKTSPLSVHGVGGDTFPKECHCSVVALLKSLTASQSAHKAWLTRQERLAFLVKDG